MCAGSVWHAAKRCSRSSKDPARPFIVDAGGAIARAVGTRFGVDRLEDRVRVIVNEGKVAVVRGDQAAALEHDVDHERRDRAGTGRARGDSINAPAVPLHKETVNSTHALAWASGQLILQQSTVGVAVQEFNRRNRLQIEVETPSIADWHVYWLFDAGDPEAFARTLASMGNDIALVREGPDTLAARSATIRPGRSTFQGRRDLTARTRVQRVRPRNT